MDALFLHIHHPLTHISNKFLNLTVAREVMKDLLVKDHTCKGKESFHVKPRRNLCQFCGRLFPLNYNKLAVSVYVIAAVLCGS